jgi:ribosome-binding ATPase YchF (GTP1/OBG family)
VFLRKAYELLQQISFFTVGEDEVRAWAVRQGATAPEAAGRIHTDLQRGFIRAEVIHYDAFLQAGSMAAAKATGTLRLEGKQYVVHDGDIMHVRHA